MKSPGKDSNADPFDTRQAMIQQIKDRYESMWPAIHACPLPQIYLTD